MIGRKGNSSDVIIFSNGRIVWKIFWNYFWTKKCSGDKKEKSITFYAAREIQINFCCKINSKYFQLQMIVTSIQLALYIIRKHALMFHLCNEILLTIEHLLRVCRRGSSSLSSLKNDCYARLSETSKFHLYSATLIFNKAPLASHALNS